MTSDATLCLLPCGSSVFGATWPTPNAKLLRVGPAGPTSLPNKSTLQPTKSSKSGQMLVIWACQLCIVPQNSVGSLSVKSTWAPEVGGAKWMTSCDSGSVDMSVSHTCNCRKGRLSVTVIFSLSNRWSNLNRELEKLLSN